MPKSKRKTEEYRPLTPEERAELERRVDQLFAEAIEKARTLPRDEFVKWWDEHVAIKAGGAYEALLEIREAMRGWNSRRKKRNRKSVSS
ncbi:MAG: S49 family peptidase [Armatimonadetes bacterium]|nr:S49 family peptidase [Armatimonadota bacterium]MCX7968068.1 S49 family peptidase [Armatimonadota bacterium]MDW8143518.1 hypothetical protein [Armatimonadota bacterium]